MGCYIHTVIVFVIRKAVVTVMIGNYIHGLVVVEGSLFSLEYGMHYQANNTTIQDTYVLHEGTAIYRVVIAKTILK